VYSVDFKDFDVDVQSLDGARGTTASTE